MRSSVPVSLLLVALLATSIYSHAFAAPDAPSSDPVVDDAPEPTIGPALLDALDAEEIERLRAQAEPMIRAWDHTVEMEMQQPIPEIENGIGPGSALRISRPDGNFLCTANFIWTDDFDRLYLGTAGHCLLPEDATATHGPGADYDPNQTRVEVRIGQCPVSALGAGCGIGGSGSPWESLGSVTYARNTGPGDDFGIIEIPQHLEDQVRHELPVWGMPNGEGDVGIGDSVLLYGQGFVVGDAFATRSRAGIGLSTGSTVEGFWPGYEGDSGSALVSGTPSLGPNVLESHEAVGIFTHIQVLPVPGIMIGTPIEVAKMMVGNHIGLRIWTLPGGQPLPGLEEPDPINNNETLGPGTVIVRHDHAGETTALYNYRWSNGWERVRIIVNAGSESGEVRLQVRDEDNNTVYSMGTDASYSNDRVINDAPRNIWNLTVEFEGHVGTFALRIEEADPENSGSGSSGSISGETRDDAVADERPQPLPGPAFGLVLLLLGSALLLGRRRSRR